MRWALGGARRPLELLVRSREARSEPCAATIAVREESWHSSFVEGFARLLPSSWSRCASATLPLSLVAFVFSACLDNPYVIGRQCVQGEAECAPPDGGEPPECGEGGCDGLTFVLPLDASGPSLLADLEIGASVYAPALRLDGQNALVDRWVATRGADLPRAPAGPAPALDLPAPFTDGTRAVGFAPGGAVYAAADASAFDLGEGSAVIEIVFRAAADTELFDKKDDLVGHRLALGADGSLWWSVGDGATTASVASTPLTSGAWHHCLLYLTRLTATDARGRIDCNGQPGPSVTLGDLGALGSAAALEVGGDGPAAEPSQIAELALFPSPAPFAPAAELDAVLDEASARRFAALTGVLPELARGAPLALGAGRTSAAYLDLAEGATDPRRLFLVGAHWPRIACRVGGDGARFCGYLVEQQSTSAYGGATEAADWTAEALTTTPDAMAFPDGTARMDALIADASIGAHVLSRGGDFAGSRQAFSFFARRGSSAFIGASIGAEGLAIYDLEAGEVVSAPAGVEAALEPWGDGLYRCVYLVDVPEGALEHRIHLVADAAGAAFAGDGTTPTTYVAAIQVEPNLGYPSSLIPEGGRDRDRLGFRADDGNLPPGGPIHFEARVLVPTSTRLTDQTVLNLSQGRSFDDQMNLFLAARGSFEFDARANGEAQWGFQHPANPFDGLPHRVAATVDLPALGLVVDDAEVTFTPTGSVAPEGLDFIDVGQSDHAAGPLEGLIQGVRIGPEAP
jgi:hypothetical protein